MEGAVAIRIPTPPAHGGLRVAVPDYFRRNAVAISQVMSGLDEERLASLLGGVCIGVTIGADAGGREGTATVDLLTRLLARLYPSIAFRDDASGGVADRSSALARRIQSTCGFVRSADGRDRNWFGARTSAGSAKGIRGIWRLVRPIIDTPPAAVREEQQPVRCRTGGVSGCGRGVQTRFPR